jgi:uncharacterized protein YegP (UPF0339 family)
MGNRQPRPVHFVIYQGKDGQWYIRSTRGKITTTFGEGYRSKSNARRALRTHFGQIMNGNFLVDGDSPYA